MSGYKNADSAVQRGIEKYLLEEFKKETGFTKLDSEDKKEIEINETTKIVPDFYSDEYKIIGEIHTHQGALKPSQKHKIANDILKMLLFDKMKGVEYQKFIVVCSENERKQLEESNSFLCLACKAFEITIKKYELTAELENKLAETVEKQNMYGKKSYDE